jgi:hypothetical protein
MTPLIIIGIVIILIVLATRIGDINHEVELLRKDLRKIKEDKEDK